MERRAGPARMSTTDVTKAGGWRGRWATRRRRALARLLGRHAAPAHLSPLKLAAIDVAFRRLDVRSIADLGGVWAVDAGYAAYAAERYAPDRVVEVDEDFTPAVERLARRLPALELQQGNFGSAAVAERLGEVDAICLFDVLLHQVSPDWDAILELYAERTGAFLVVNPQWVRTSRTVRLTDLPRDEYLAVVPDQENHRLLHDRLDEIDERRGRPWRDVHDVWQWGITDADLRAKLGEFGFTLVHFENHGSWFGLPYDYCSYVAARRARLGAPG
jgi:hypothetical protein